MLNVTTIYNPKITYNYTNPKTAIANPNEDASKSINYWSFPGGLEGSLDVYEALRLAKEHGFEAIELGIGDLGALHLGTSEGECRRIRAAAQEMGLSTASVASGLGCTGGDCDPAKRAKAKDDLEKMIRIANWLGAKTLLTIPGAVEVFFLPDLPTDPYD